MSRSLAILAALAFLSPRFIVAQSGDRTLMHTFQKDSHIVYVAIFDLPTGPQGLITFEGGAPKERPFTVSRAQFEKMWSTLTSAGAEEYAKYAGDQKADRTYDAVNYYVFSAALMPHGWKKNYAIPSSKAPSALVDLAKQFRAFAK